MKTYRKFKPIKNTNVRRITSARSPKYPLQNDVNKIAIKQPQTNEVALSKQFLF